MLLQSWHACGNFCAHEATGPDNIVPNTIRVQNNRPINSNASSARGTWSRCSVRNARLQQELKHRGEDDLPRGVERGKDRKHK